MTNKNLKEELEKEICTCNKQWLDENNHYANCPIFKLESLLSQQKEEWRKELEGMKKTHEELEPSGVCPRKYETCLVCTSNEVLDDVIKKLKEE